MCLTECVRTPTSVSLSIRACRSHAQRSCITLRIPLVLLKCMWDPSIESKFLVSTCEIAHTIYFLHVTFPLVIFSTILTPANDRSRAEDVSHQQSNISSKASRYQKHRIQSDHDSDEIEEVTPAKKKPAVHAPASELRKKKQAVAANVAAKQCSRFRPVTPFTPHERGPEPVVSNAFCDMSQNATKRAFDTTGCGISPVVESDKLEITEIIYCQTGFAVSFGLD